MSFEIASSALSAVASSHSQMISTVHPSARSLRMFLASLARFALIFSLQKLALVLGVCPMRHLWPCQKQPLTRITVLNEANTRSGRPGSRETCSRYLKPWECRALRTYISGVVSFERISDMRMLRCLGVRESTISQIVRVAKNQAADSSLLDNDCATT